MTVVLRHEIYEMANARPYPIVVHEFRGATEEEAFNTYVAHLESDAFLRGCVEHGEYVDLRGRRIKCHVSWSYLPQGQTQAKAQASAANATSMVQPAQPAQPIASVQGTRVAQVSQGADRVAVWKSIPSTRIEGAPADPFAQQSAQQSFVPRVIAGGNPKATRAQQAPQASSAPKSEDVCDVKTG